MAIKQIAKPINAAKNKFLRWLRKNDASDVDVYDGRLSQGTWDYYRHITGFIRGEYFYVYFTMYKGRIKIEYSFDWHQGKYSKDNIEEFLELLENDQK